MINLSEITNSQPLIVLRGEYGIVNGEDSLIAAPNPQKGVILILTDDVNKITAMAHFDCEENIEENIEEIIAKMLERGADLKNLKSHIVENDKL